MNFTIAIPRNSRDVERVFEAETLSAFDPLIVDYIEAVSQRLLHDRRVAMYSELVALGFWMRKSSMMKLRQKYLAKQAELYPRGLVFHIAPSNVDTIFVYSWFLSMLCGNSNIVRVSYSSGEQVELLLDVLGDVLEGGVFEPLKSMIRVVRYGHDDAVTALFSNACQMRVIWGGDETVRRIRAIPVPTTATELTFADKFSLCIIDGDAYSVLNETEKKALSERFYNDVFVFLQNGCSSPRALIWIGNTSDAVKTEFWERLDDVLHVKQPEIPAALVMDKWVAECTMAIETEGIRISGFGHGVQRIAIDTLDQIEHGLHCGGGLFYELNISEIHALERSFFDKKVQTISYFGIQREQWLAWLSDKRPLGVDRIVPVGKALDFSESWDGFELMEHFSRRVEIL